MPAAHNVVMYLMRSGTAFVTSYCCQPLISKQKMVAPV